MRKVIHTTYIPETGKDFAYILAVCDDGTLWRLPTQGPDRNAWFRFYQISQD